MFEDSLFSFDGNVIFANFHAARVFAQNMNDRKNLALNPELAAHASQVNAMALIDEILHIIIDQYRKERYPRLIEDALDWLVESVGEDEMETSFAEFLNQFPITPVYRLEISPADYLSGISIRPDGSTVSNRTLLLEEMLMLHLANLNPAYSPYRELFDDRSLKNQTAYPAIITGLTEFFGRQPDAGPQNVNLFEMLRAPALTAPDSLLEQLEFLRARVGDNLGQFIFRLLGGLDLVKEEEKIVIGFGGGEGVPILPYEFTDQEPELENFSQDLDWMPRLVLIAKNSFVWLDQLSKKYQTPITHLDQIPDEELDGLARWGITGLWLIGLWERSKASQTIKQLRGNPEAVASAYSLMRYDIASDLGGQEAYQKLRERAWKRGIRLAADMVPNHMGIDSNWVIEHPDWFISIDYPPFPTYSFNGPNLSGDNRVGIFIEDHYFDNSDAAVVFKRTDFWTGSTKYIYHGNDGTSMPWNDTAQLNYLLPGVREAVIQTILHVARQFPVIRFDAAMTLAKKHFERLWFPEPGHGGDIPSRAESAMTKDQFEAAFPVEFWREVVDRIGLEAPDTLLLAEAFWLMEGYFVRTLGMHRVYNSAFMNMLRDERNQEYRQVIKNTLEFEPEILKRYVNFMNNPDEKTAVEQFGKGDKYFGVLTLMITMPGLPMLGHGQIEGLAEKYGMEYRQAYWDEQTDSYLVERHEREIFPLIRKRALFAEVKDFLLYDFYTPEGFVNEDVYAYSNSLGAEHTLIIYYNRYASTRGWIRLSTPYPLKATDQDERGYIQKSLGEGLHLHNEPGYFTIFSEQNSALEFIRSSQELFQDGLYLELNSYQSQVFMNFQEVLDDELQQYAHLAEQLKGQPVPDVEEAIQEILLEPLHSPYRELVNPGWFSWLIDNRSGNQDQDAAVIKPADGGTAPPARHQTTAPLETVLNDAENRLLDFFEAARVLSEGEGDLEPVAERVQAELQALLSIDTFGKQLDIQPSQDHLQAAVDYLLAGPPGQGPLGDGGELVWGTLLSFVFNHLTSQAILSDITGKSNLALLDEWLLGKIILRTLRDLGCKEEQAARQIDLLKLLIAHHNWFRPPDLTQPTAFQTLSAWLNDMNLQRYLKINRYDEIIWFNKESLEQLLWWFFATAAIQFSAELYLSEQDPDAAAAMIGNCFEIIQKLQASEAKSGYQLQKLVRGVEG